MFASIQALIKNQFESARSRVGQKSAMRAFVLSGGGNLGACQVGMLRALAEHGVVPDLIVGCSVGALNGAAFGYSPDLRGVEVLEDIWEGLAKREPDLIPNSFVPFTARMAKRGQSIQGRETLEELIDGAVPARDFEDLKVPFECVATDIDLAEEYWFTSGPLMPALLASAALPIVYPPYEYKGRTLIDGNVLREIHAERAADLGATEIYLLHVGHLDSRRHEVNRPFDSALRAYWINRRFRFHEELRNLPPNVTVHILPAGVEEPSRFDDYSQSVGLASNAYRASTQYLATGKSPQAAE